jgi:hypothetical protein
VLRELVPHLLELEAVGDQELVVGVDAESCRGEESEGSGGDEDEREGGPAVAQIGRASCRERVLTVV